MTALSRVCSSRGEAAFAVDAHPGAGFANDFCQVATGQHLRGILPPVHGRRGAGIEFIAIAGNHQGIVRV